MQLCELYFLRGGAAWGRLSHASGAGDRRLSCSLCCQHAWSGMASRSRHRRQTPPRFSSTASERPHAVGPCGWLQPARHGAPRRRRIMVLTPKTDDAVSVVRRCMWSCSKQTASCDRSARSRPSCRRSCSASRRCPQSLQTHGRAPRRSMWRCPFRNTCCRGSCRCWMR